MNIFPISKIPQKFKYKVVNRIGSTYLGTITHVITEKPYIALTFDDGPDPELTPKVLEILKKYNALGTFFMIGRNAKEYPQIVKQVAQEGHTICNHSWDHPRFPEISSKERKRQIEKCSNVLNPYEVKIFRPPHCNQTIGSRIDIKKLGYSVVTANVEIRDWETDDADRMVNMLLQKVSVGSIILLHDALNSSPNRKRDGFLKALDTFLNTTQTHYQFKTLPELLQSGVPHKVNWILVKKR